MLFALLGIGAGIGIAMQTAMNAQLRKFVISPFLASMISFTVGLIFLTASLLISGSPLGIPTEVFVNEPIWIWLGGLLGVIALTTNILLFPKLGSVQTSVMPILGMILMSMLIDNFGWFNSSKQPFGLNRVWGVILVLLGVILAVAIQGILQQRKVPNTSNKQSSEQWIWRCVGIISGMLMSTQAAINGQLGKALHSSLHAAFVSFAIGLVILILLIAVKERSFANIAQPVKQSAPWWVWVGGILGGIYVLGNAFLVGEIGTGQTVMLALFGQITGSLLVEQFGLMRSIKNKVMLIQIVGLIIMLSGVFLIKMF